MKKVLLKFVAIGGLALSIFSCSNDADNSDIIKLAAVNSADTAETVETGVVRAVKNSSSSTAVATLYSDLNPGYGSAVYFTGSFCNWKTAFRGDYSKKDGWHISIETDEVFEWKALTGPYKMGSLIERTFSGLKYSKDVSAPAANPKCKMDVGYGNAVYFVGDKSPTVAVRGEYVSGVWTVERYDNSDVFKVYVGKWAFGKKVGSVFKDLTWESGDNNVYDGTKKGDGIVTRRALLISNFDEDQIVCEGSGKAIKKALKKQTFDGEKISIIEWANNLTNKEISEKFRTFFKDTDEDDVSYVYFDCHGGGDGSIAIGIDDDVAMTGLGVRTMFDKYVRGEVVFLLDCCHAGYIIDRGLGNDDFAENFISFFKAPESDSRSGELADTRFHVLCSSSKTEVSYSWPGDISCGSYVFAKGLGWDADDNIYVGLLSDANDDKKVSMKEFYEFSFAEMNSCMGDGFEQTVVVYPDNDEFIVGGHF